MIMGRKSIIWQWSCDNIVLTYIVFTFEFNKVLICQRRNQGKNILCNTLYVPLWVWTNDSCNCGRRMKQIFLSQVAVILAWQYTVPPSEWNYPRARIALPLENCHSIRCYRNAVSSIFYSTYSSLWSVSNSQLWKTKILIYAGF